MFPGLMFSGAVPGRLPNHGFREGSGAVFRDRVPGRFGKVPGQYVPQTLLGITPGLFFSV